MRRYQKWLSVGLLALTPGITLAGPFSKKDPKAAAPAAAKKAPNANQETAERVKDALKKAKLSGYEIDISVAGGVASLSGMVGSPQQRLAAQNAASSVKGVSRVDASRLTVAEPMPRGGIQQAAASQPRSARPARVPRGAIQQAAAYDGIEPSQLPAEAPMQPEAMQQIPPQGGPAYGPPPGPAPAPMYGAPVAGASHSIYNQPNTPNYAWPAYAQYPNYAAVTYPTQYSASAWPYIGPFYPYPQVPLGWRKATLEWDDGYWNLSFSPRTDRWWWFLDWRNW